MYGHNEVANINRNPHTLQLHSIFPTLQGEGPDAGRPAVFVRLATCNLRCHFCDTDFEHGEDVLQSQLAERIITLANRYHISLCVITGGEPLLQDFLPLTRMLNANDIYVGVETAGSVYLPGLKQLFEFDLNYIVCSPKTARLNASLIPLIKAYKYICKAGELAEDDGLPIMSTQIEGLRQRLFRPPVGTRIYLQPCDENDPIKNARNQQACVEMCLKHGYRLSLQLHKICGLD